ncbi:ChaB family protein [Marinobacteraceae bacterium S3BR75-40.1]
MPYDNKQQLPDQVTNNLPSHAQEIYRKAFNHAWEEYKNPSDRRGNQSREAVAHEVAWSAVEQKYHKENGKWQRKH